MTRESEPPIALAALLAACCWAGLMCAPEHRFAQTIPAKPVRPHITRISHVAFFVHDIEKSREFYKGFLGFGEPFLLDNPDGSLSLTFIKVNDRQYIELFPEKYRDTDRLSHISIEVDNAEAMRAYLGANGISVPDKVGKGRIKNSNFDVRDPDGHVVEIVQYEPDGWSMREKGNYMDGPRISNRILHVGILVGSLDPAMRFYRDLLGFQEIWRGSQGGKRLDWVNMKVPDGGDYIEFMLYDHIPDSNVRGTQHHVCLEVADLTQRITLSHYSAPMEIRTGTNRKRQMNLYDPDGTRIELMEPQTVDGKVPPSSSAPPPQ
jgi:lactoylglutathione lyase